MCLFKILQSDKDNVFLWTKQWADLPTASFIKLGLSSIHGSEIKNPPPSAGAASSISGSGRSPGGENGNSPQYFCRDNPMERGAWWATVHGVAKSRTWLSTQRLIKYQDSSPAILSTVGIGSNKIPSFQSWGIRGWVNWHNSVTLATAVAVSNKLSFISYPGYSPLLPIYILAREY